MVSAKQLCCALEAAGMSASAQGNIDAEIGGFSSLFRYRPGTMTFIVPERAFADYAGRFSENGIPVLIAARPEEKPAAAQCVIYVEDPRKAFFHLVETFFDVQESEEVTGISADPSVYRARSFVSPAAQIGEGVQIGVGCVIEGGVTIGGGTEIHHRVIIRSGTKIGSNCTVYSGACIGERGFNYTVGPNGEKHMLKHYGGVSIGNDVHIGENVCISRGAIDDTVICDGVKIDALAHIAHNCVIGKHSMVLVPTSISGSVEIGENCHIAADIIRNQVQVADNAMLGLGSVVVRDIPENTVAYGNPARPVRKRFEEA
ncbi:MAG: hypothetical protein E7429_00325 [Ruminococcaceae bacterium]|nr:hypothetical protein [Oscillospiraceae bacterium]